MTRISRRCVAPALALSAACAVTPAVAQPQPNARDDLARLHVYEVSPEQQTQARARAQAQAQTVGFIEVSGTAIIAVPADRAHATFAVETRRRTAGPASQANAEAMEGVLRGVRAADFPGLVIETFGYSLRPEYAVAQASREIDGYTALNNVRVTVSDVDAMGRLIDVAIEAGANRVAGLDFSASDTGDARARALAEAVTAARAEAEVIATALGRSLGEALEVRGGANAPMAGGEFLMQVEMRARTPIEPGDQSVTASVTIRFALGPALPNR